MTIWLCTATPLPPPDRTGPSSKSGIVISGAWLSRCLRPVLFTPKNPGQNLGLWHGCPESQSLGPFLKFWRPSWLGKCTSPKLTLRPSCLQQFFAKLIVTTQSFRQKTGPTPLEPSLVRIKWDRLKIPENGFLAKTQSHLPHLKNCAISAVVKKPRKNGFWRRAKNLSWKKFNHLSGRNINSKPISLK